jgi:hypothetical protein
LESAQGFFMTTGKRRTYSYDCSFAHIYPARENVEPLIHQVSDARHKSFSTHEQAVEFYLGAKKLGRVRIVRNPGDDEKYGPREDGIQ